MLEKLDARGRNIEQNGRVERYDGSAIECSLADITASGARLRSDQPDLIPNEFMLVIREVLRRRCNVVVRRGNSIGIVFVGLPENE
jgi:hypothetical protein